MAANKLSELLKGYPDRGSPNFIREKNNV